LEKILLLKEVFIKTKLEDLPEEITKLDLISKMKEDFFNSYDLRLAVDGKKRDRSAL
jgi:hypothetical protein